MRLIRSLVLGVGVLTATLGAAQPAHAIPSRGVIATDEVIFWNNVLLDMFRLDYGTGCPCPLEMQQDRWCALRFGMRDAVIEIDSRELARGCQCQPPVGRYAAC